MSPPSSRRCLGLDALRGLAILGMLLSAAVPYGVLPTWMYHAQVPPPEHVFDPTIPGITWVDIVFPFFLFALGMSIPLALNRRVSRGDSDLALAVRVLARGVALGAFAIALQHLRPWILSEEPTASTYGIAVLGFCLLFPTFARLPDRMSVKVRWVVRGLGWAFLIALLALLRYPDGSGFSLAHSDIILILLTNAAVAGGLMWVFTRDRPAVRLGLLGVLLAMRLGATEAGWVQVMWGWTPIPWLFRWEYLTYLAIVIPGTLVGDRWVRSHGKLQSLGSWSDRRLRAIALTQVVLLATVLVGLQERLGLAWLLVCAGLAVINWLLLLQPEGTIEHLMADWYRWGGIWLGMGLLLEPYEMGIKKDPPTLSYYFVCSGLAIFLLIACTIAIHQLGGVQLFSLAIANGQNPMIAYAALANLSIPGLALVGIDGWMNGLPVWIQLAYGLGAVWLTAAIVRWLTHRRVVWKT
ncbi:MAG: DUF5009 domain-containing protein [Cyanobacteria bacterium P01_E01_bin.34]